MIGLMVWAVREEVATALQAPPLMLSFLPWTSLWNLKIFFLSQFFAQLFAAKTRQRRVLSLKRLRVDDSHRSAPREARLLRGPHDCGLVNVAPAELHNPRMAAMAHHRTDSRARVVIVRSVWSSSLALLGNAI